MYRLTKFEMVEDNKTLYSQYRVHKYWTRSVIDTIISVALSLISTQSQWEECSPYRIRPTSSPIKPFYGPRIYILVWKVGVLARESAPHIVRLCSGHAAFWHAGLQ